jgi:hypothetical protein
MTTKEATATATATAAATAKAAAKAKARQIFCGNVWIEAAVRVR